MLYSITFTSLETGLDVRAQGTWESARKARNYAAKLAETFRDVIVWRGQPGGERAFTVNPRCDAELFGDRCEVCSPA